MSNIRIQCEKCNRLISAHTIKTHMKTCGEDSDCRFCGKKFCTPYYRKLHEQTHNKNFVRRILTCTECNANFTATSSLNNHKKKCSRLQEKKIKSKTVLLQPFEKVAKVNNVKISKIESETTPVDVVHLADEDIAAVETISSEAERKTGIPIKELNENCQKVKIESVPQFHYVNSKLKNI